MSKQPNKKDKGKAVQKAEDYRLQIPVQNQFTPLTFPPLPYKTAVTNPLLQVLQMTMLFALRSIYS